MSSSRPLSAALLALALNFSAPVTFSAPGATPQDIVYSPRPPDGARAARSGDSFLLTNNTLEVAWTLEAGKLYLTRVSDRTAGTVRAQRNEVFEITLDKTRIPASDCRLAAPPAIEPIAARPDAVRFSERIAGRRLSARFTHAATGATILWNAELRDGSHYLRQTISVESPKGTLTLVRAMSADIGAARPVGTAAAGNPVCSDDCFMGMEQPMSRNRAGEAALDAGRWTPDDMQTKSISRPVTGLSAGPLSVDFAYERGSHRLDLTSARLVVNGKTVSEDRHAGWSGGASQGNTYRLNVPAGIAVAELQVTLGGPAADTDSFGRITLSQGAFGTPVGGGASTCDLPCRLDLVAGKPYTFSAVLGVHPQGQLRRAFLRYIERERAAPYRQFLHYNGWFDFDRNVTEKGMLETIAAYDKELIKKRGVPVKAFVIDDGWDDWDSGFWAINRRKFPNDFKAVGKELQRVNSRFGIWISPLAGYDHSDQRIALAAKDGLTPKGAGHLDLSYRPYYDWFLKKTSDLVKDDKVAYFKFDKAGSGVNPHFLALLDICRELRRNDPNLVVNITVGTWPSPFWLNHIDCTWRDGNDMGWEGFGDDREKWITYRDAQTWRGVVSKGPLYPLNAIMNHGVVLSNGHQFAARAYKAGTDMKNEVRSFFGSGTLMQELYVKPAITPDAAWDQIAEAAKWSAANAEVLVDTHWIGGDPSKGANVYGWAAWTPRKAVLTLRNPSDSEKTYPLDIADAFELPAGAAKRYAVKGAYADTPAPFTSAEAGKTASITLKPLQVLVLEFTPVK